MQVKLTTITPDCENLISYCARVSNPDNQENHETAPRLLRYLIDHEHWSPFEMGHMVLEIETSRAISAQLLRHRSFSFQEFSQRYSTSLEFEPIEFRKQTGKNRQSSEEIATPYATLNYAKFLQSLLAEEYRDLLDKGVSRETARMILPLCTRTRLYMAGNIRSWIHYIQLRTKPDTQKEHRLIAEECKKIFIQNFPTISEALWKIKTK